MRQCFTHLHLSGIALIVCETFIHLDAELCPRSVLEFTICEVFELCIRQHAVQFLRNVLPLLDLLPDGGNDPFLIGPIQTDDETDETNDTDAHPPRDPCG